MVQAEISVRTEERLAEAMERMRLWLDHRRIEPTTFRYSFSPPGVVIAVDFTSHGEAAEFAAAFGGRVKDAASY